MALTESSLDVLSPVICFDKYIMDLMPSSLLTNSKRGNANRTTNWDKRERDNKNQKSTVLTLQ